MHRWTPRLSAAGMSAWTFDLIRQITFKNKLLIQAITAFLNLLLAGKGGESSPLLTCRLIALKKPTGGLRPIAISDVWLRLLGRCASAKVSRSVGDRLSSCQLGLGISGGAEIVVHSVHLLKTVMEARHNGEQLFDHECGFTEDDPLCILTLDWSNAFNRMGRLAIHRALEEHRPDLLPYFRWAYSTVHLRWYLHLRRQGDPLGPLFFDVAIHPILQRFKTNHKELLLALGFHDDTTLAGKRSLLVRIVHELTNLYR
jgi:hypothetical protein